MTDKETKMADVIWKALIGLMGIVVCVCGWFLTELYSSQKESTAQIAELTQKIGQIEVTRWSLRDEVEAQGNHSNTHQEHAKKHTDLLSIVGELQIQIGQLVLNGDGVSSETRELINDLSKKVQDNSVSINSLEHGLDRETDNMLIIRDKIEEVDRELDRLSRG